ncbi:hypothetical protein F5B20DRAFT_268270 [Whalleya microplaca]|nr:hypothetical protein F5B20DRAFT_268270 [Whalleya microplaca]
MQFTTYLAATAALVLGANAGVVQQRDGPRLAQFRVFGATGCHDLNYGFYTVDQSDTNACKTFVNTPDTGILSVNLEQLYPTANGCDFYIYTDTNCSAGRRSISKDVCNNPLTTDAKWGSWQMSCGGGSA